MWHWNGSLLSVPLVSQRHSLIYILLGHIHTTQTLVYFNAGDG